MLRSLSGCAPLGASCENPHRYVRNATGYRWPPCTSGVGTVPKRENSPRIDERLRCVLMKRAASCRLRLRRPGAQLMAEGTAIARSQAGAGGRGRRGRRRDHAPGAMARSPAPEGEVSQPADGPSERRPTGLSFVRLPITLCETRACILRTADGGRSSTVLPSDDRCHPQGGGPSPGGQLPASGRWHVRSASPDRDRTVTKTVRTSHVPSSPEGSRRAMQGTALT